MVLDHLIFGSTSLAIQYPEIFDNERTKSYARDIDILVRDKKFLQGTNGIAEYHHLGDEATELIFEMNKSGKLVDPDIAYVIKLSHLSWDINWNKHSEMCCFLSRKFPNIMQDQNMRKLYDALYKHHETVYGKKKVSMNMSNEEFFADAVSRKYDHDFLHSLIAIEKEPAYKQFLVDPNKPLFDNNKFINAGDVDKMSCALEETLVIAIERYDFMNSYTDKVKSKISIKKALKNLITSMTSGEFNLFLKMNYADLLFSKEADSFYKTACLNVT